jgi:hypothetical protein
MLTRIAKAYVPRVTHLDCDGLLSKKTARNDDLDGLINLGVVRKQRSAQGFTANYKSCSHSLRYRL